MASKPKIEYGFDFEGRRIKRMTFSLKEPDCAEQIVKALTKEGVLRK